MQSHIKKSTKYIKYNMGTSYVCSSVHTSVTLSYPTQMEFSVHVDGQVIYDKFECLSLREMEMHGLSIQCDNRWLTGQASHCHILQSRHLHLGGIFLCRINKCSHIIYVSLQAKSIRLLLQVRTSAFCQKESLAIWNSCVIHLMTYCS